MAAILAEVDDDHAATSRLMLCTADQEGHTKVDEDAVMISDGDGWPVVVWRSAITTNNKRVSVDVLLKN